EQDRKAGADGGVFAAVVPGAVFLLFADEVEAALAVPVVRAEEALAGEAAEALDAVDVVVGVAVDLEREAVGAAGWGREDVAEALLQGGVFRVLAAQGDRILVLLAGVQFHLGHVQAA